MDKGNSANCMILRLLINKETERILYAEAGKDFVDLLFSFLTLPTGSVIKLLSASGRPKKVACITSLYNSVEKLQTVFMNADKSQLLEPKVISPHSSDVLRIKCSPRSPDPTVYYACSSLNSAYYNSYNSRPSNGFNLRSHSDIHNISTQNGGLCACGQSISYQVQMKNTTQEDTNQGRNAFGKETGKSGSGSSGGGYVKETVTFIITDELEISPSSTITSINLLNKLNVKDLTNLEERTARVGATEALELLGASLVSTTALNDVFGPPARSNPRPQQFEEEDEGKKKNHSCDKKDEEDTYYIGGFDLLRRDTLSQRKTFGRMATSTQAELRRDEKDSCDKKDEEDTYYIGGFDLVRRDTLSQRKAFGRMATSTQAKLRRDEKDSCDKKDEQDTYYIGGFDLVRRS